MHFYVFFKDDQGGVALIHPQSKLYDEGSVFSYENKFSPENNRKLTLAFQFTM